MGCVSPGLPTTPFPQEFVGPRGGTVDLDTSAVPASVDHSQPVYQPSLLAQLLLSAFPEDCFKPAANLNTNTSLGVEQIPASLLKNK